MIDSLRPVNRARWCRLLGALCITFSTTAIAHDGHTNDKPWLACDARQIGDSCAYKNSANDVYRGTCRLMQEHLICVRNQPIEKADSSPGTSTSPARTVRFADAVLQSKFFVSPNVKLWELRQKVDE